MFITGVALVPVTFGASLGLSIAGAAVGVGAAAIGAGATFTDLALANWEKRKAKQCFENHKQKTANLIELIQKCYKISKISLSDKVVTFIVNFIVEYIQIIFAIDRTSK